jgi:hypothetical protein
MLITSLKIASSATLYAPEWAQGVVVLLIRQVG